VTAAEAAERDAIRAAADRLLDGTPLRSTGELTVVQLAAEAGVKRWLLTHKHRDLAEHFQARARLLAGDPPPIAALKKKISELEDDNARLKAADAERQTLTEFYTHIVNELSAELDRVTTERDELLGNVRSISLAPSRRAPN
jgi:transposase-like protein